MIDLNTLIITDKIAKLGTFTAAAKALSIPSSNLSLKVKQLEEELGQPLFLRSTRRVMVTEFGQMILETAKPLVDVREHIIAICETAHSEPRGTLRLTAPYDIGLDLLRFIIPSFTKRYESLTVEVDLTNTYVDLLAEGFDLAIRASRQPLTDSTHVAVKLSETPFLLYAHKDSSFIHLKSIEELQKVPLYSMTREIKLSMGQRHKTLKAKAPIIVKDMAGLKQAVLGQAGVGVFPLSTKTADSSFRVLTNIFPKWSAGKASVYALYPRGASLSPKVRAFVDFLKGHYVPYSAFKESHDGEENGS